MEERNTSFSGNCSGKHGFTGARRPEEKKGVRSIHIHNGNPHLTDPVRSTPFGSLPPRDANVVGSFKKATMSCSSYQQIRMQLSRMEPKNNITYLLRLIHPMNITELNNFSFRRFKLILTRTSFHETSVLEEDR